MALRIQTEKLFITLKGKTNITSAKGWRTSTAAQVPLLANLATSFYLSNAAERHLCERQTNEPIDVTDFGGGGAISLKNVEFRFFANSTK